MTEQPAHPWWRRAFVPVGSSPDDPYREDSARVVGGKAVVSLVLLCGLGAAWLFRPEEQVYGPTYWRAEPVAATGWLLGALVVAVAATIAASRIPSRETGPWRGVSLVLCFVMFTVLALFVTPLTPPL